MQFFLWDNQSEVGGEILAESRNNYLESRNINMWHYSAKKSSPKSFYDVNLALSTVFSISYKENNIFVVYEGFTAGTTKCVMVWLP